MLKWIVAPVVVIALLAGCVFVAFKVSPWPSVLMIRHGFSDNAATTNTTMEAYVPAGIAELLDEPYGEAPAERLDVFRRAGISGVQPTVVWIHGGAFIAGDKRDLAPYLKILAGKGYTAVAIGYSVAPGGRYPGPVLQANAALAWLLRNAERLNIDPHRIVLAGDSAGAQIASQLAAGISDPTYAASVGFTPALDRTALRAVVLMCGVYSMQGIDMDGPFGGFLRTVLWSYFGTRDFANDPRLNQFSVDKHITAAFPPTFISVGNGDPLAPQSGLIARAIAAQGVEVDTLFLPDDHVPPLPHEYQFNFDLEAARLALDRLLSFLSAHSG